MSVEFPKYPPLKPEPVPIKKEDPVARSLAKPDACAKPATFAKGVRVRPMSGDKSLKRRKRKDPRDVQFY